MQSVYVNFLYVISLSKHSALEFPLQHFRRC